MGTHSVTDKVRKETQELAARYVFSQQAVLTLFEALIAGHGSMAQFSHPEFGGMGQWTRGGMIMIGDMFNTSLRAKVNGLCEDLVNLLDHQPELEMHEQPLSQLRRQDGGGTLAAAKLGPLHTDERSADWWGAELGVPSSAGSQGNVRYAYFSATRRLAISTGGKVTVYDTKDHEITGFSQQQGSEATLTFASQHGPVRVSSLHPVPMVSAGDENAEQARNADIASNTDRTTDAGEDVLSKLERLAELCKRGIVSQEEFAAKKAELLARL